MEIIWIFWPIRCLNKLLSFEFSPAKQAQLTIFTWIEDELLPLFAHDGIFWKENKRKKENKWERRKGKKMEGSGTQKAKLGVFPLSLCFIHPLTRGSKVACRRSGALSGKNISLLSLFIHLFFL